MTELCRECWCDHDASDCIHCAVEQVGARWLCRAHAELAKRRDGRFEPIKCPQCGYRSYNPHDVREKYCGNCHQFHDTMVQA